MLNKAKIFVFDAGKIIMLISLILWGLSTYGPPEKMRAVAEKYEQLIISQPEQKAELTHQKNAELLQNSFAGILGQSIEPVIEPLGFDWKIGIALVTSFAAREVFVGTMATLYSVEGGNDADQSTLTEKMNAAVRSDGTKIYSLATGLSLMIFYVFAMQCMSTLAVVGNQNLEMAYHTINLYDRPGLHIKPYSVSGFKVV